MSNPLTNAISSLIGSGLEFLSGIGSGISSYFAQKKQNEFNKEMYEDWKEYNTPSNQMKRLTDAGVNPYMVSGVSNTLSQPFQIGQQESLADMFSNAQSAFRNFSDMQSAAYQKSEQRKLTDKIQTEKLRQAWDGLKIRDRLASVAEKKGDAAAALLWKQGTIADINKEILQRTKTFTIGKKFYDYLRSQQDYTFNELMNPQVLDFYAPFRRSEINRNNASAAQSMQQVKHLSFLDRYMTHNLLFNKDKFYNYEFPFKVDKYWSTYDQRRRFYQQKSSLADQYYKLANRKFISDVVFKGLGTLQRDRDAAFSFLENFLPY